MMNVTATGLLTALVPPITLDPRMEAIVMRFALRVLQGAREDFINERYGRFDGNPGDSQCQVRAICVFTLVTQMKQNILAEMDQLCADSGLPLDGNTSGKGMTGLACCVNNMVCTQRTEQVGQVRQGFAALNVSLPLRFLLQVYLSELMREVAQVDAQTGQVLTRGEADQLRRIDSSLSAPKLRSLRVAILRNNQTQLSALSEQVLQSLMPGEYYPRCVNQIRGNTDVPLRTFTSLVHTTRAALQILCKQRGVICLREIVPKTKTPVNSKRCQLQSERIPLDLFYQAPPVLEGVWRRLADSVSPVLIIEMVPLASMEEVSTYFRTRSVGSAILQQAASCDPYEPGSTIRDVPDETAQEEVMAYKQLERPPFLLDHYFVEGKNV